MFKHLMKINVAQYSQNEYMKSALELILAHVETLVKIEGEKSGFDEIKQSLRTSLSSIAKPPPPPSSGAAKCMNLLFADLVQRNRSWTDMMRTNDWNALKIHFIPLWQITLSIFHFHLFQYSYLW